MPSQRSQSSVRAKIEMRVPAQDHAQSSCGMITVSRSRTWQLSLDVRSLHYTASFAADCSSVYTPYTLRHKVSTYHGLQLSLTLGSRILLGSFVMKPDYYRRR
jgi:hypothetical protein